jgi:DNA-binding NarL/FixJ family response regulator
VRRRGDGDGAGILEEDRTLRVVVADQHRLILLAMATVLEDADGVELVASTNRGTAVVPLVNEHAPDVVILNAKLPDIDGLLVLERLRRHFPAVKVVIFDEDSRLLETARERGACAYISKHIDPSLLAEALHEAVASDEFVSLGFPEQAELSPPPGLTNRELAILKTVAAGHTNKQVAAALFVTEQTVKFHLTNIYRKLDLRSRTDAARFAHQHGLAENSYLVGSEAAAPSSEPGAEGRVAGNTPAISRPGMNLA